MYGRAGIYYRRRRRKRHGIVDIKMGLQSSTYRNRTTWTTWTAIGSMLRYAFSPWWSAHLGGGRAPQLSIEEDPERASASGRMELSMSAEEFRRTNCVRCAVNSNACGPRSDGTATAKSGAPGVERGSGARGKFPGMRSGRRLDGGSAPRQWGERPTTRNFYFSPTFYYFPNNRCILNLKPVRLSSEHSKGIKRSVAHSRYCHTEWCYIPKLFSLTSQSTIINNKK